MSIWLPRLPSDRVLRMRAVDAPFALVQRQENADRLYCLNQRAEKLGLQRGMALAEARAYCPDLQQEPADLRADARFLAALRRWALRYCPWVAVDGTDGLLLDITGSDHLIGGEAALLADLRRRMRASRITAQLGLGDNRGAAWALARYGEGIAQPGQGRTALAPLSVAALRIEPEITTALQRVGLRSISDLLAQPRASLARRFGPALLLRLDQALGTLPEQISPEQDSPPFSVRMSLPEPIGLVGDVMAAVERLVIALCHRLRAQDMGARMLNLSLERVDHSARQIELRLASALRDPARIMPLFHRGIADVDAGFGIDGLRLRAVQVEPLPPEQLGDGLTGAARDDSALSDLITRLGSRIGIENIRRLLPAESHIPERSFLVAPSAFSEPAPDYTPQQPRPLTIFPPEPVRARGTQPPARFQWRRMSFTTLRATGPERIAPEWWMDDEGWRSGMRDYWRVETHQGRRLWMFHTPQNPGWQVQGEFP
ncbi:Y-family DNA polymerase [Paracoccus caeni]